MTAPAHPGEILVLCHKWETCDKLVETTRDTTLEIHMISNVQSRSVRSSLYQ